MVDTYPLTRDRFRGSAPHQPSVIGYDNKFLWLGVAELTHTQKSNQPPVRNIMIGLQRLLKDPIQFELYHVSKQNFNTYKWHFTCFTLAWKQSFSPKRSRKLSLLTLANFEKLNPSLRISEDATTILASSTCLKKPLDVSITKCSNTSCCWWWKHLLGGREFVLLLCILMVPCVEAVELLVWLQDTLNRIK